MIPITEAFCKRVFDSYKLDTVYVIKAQKLAEEFFMLGIDAIASSTLFEYSLKFLKVFTVGTLVGKLYRIFSYIVFPEYIKTRIL